jgi:AAA+ ATPase superfamily predicted ATPase
MKIDKVLSYSSPLYGRRTASRKLKPFKFFPLERILSDYEKHYGVIAREVEVKNSLVWDLGDFTFSV